jgi:plasmid stabilization system protein ParE
MSLSKKLPIVWDLNEFERFKELIKKIKRRSENLAQNIKNNVKTNLNLIKTNPHLFEVDSLKIGNDGSYRKFICIHLKIAYKIEEDYIIIVRVRLANGEPSEY